MTQVAGRTVLVTGAASGIGRQMALDFARRGARLVLWDLAPEPLDQVVRAVCATGSTCIGFVCDVGDRADVRACAARVHTEVGPVDVLVNNAGVVSGRTLRDLTDEEIERTFRVNVLAHFWTTRAFLPAMAERRSGHIVTIASTAGMAGAPRLTAYTASKHAAVGFNEALRAELARTLPSIRTTLVMPHYVDTGMFDGVSIRFPRLLPMLRAEDVSRRVVDAVEHDHERLMMPPIAHLVPFLKTFPPGICDGVLGALGVTASMDSFVGRRRT